MDPAQMFLEAFNAGDFARLRSLMAPGYTYTDRNVGGRLDADQHVAAMQRVIDIYPDRRIELRERLDGESTTALIGVWRGTRASGEEPMAVEVALVLWSDGAQIRSGASYYLE